NPHHPPHLSAERLGPALPNRQPGPSAAAQSWQRAAAPRSSATPQAANGIALPPTHRLGHGTCLRRPALGVRIPTVPRFHASPEAAMGLKPIGDRIIVRREAAEEKTSGGILLPDTAKNKPQRGEVLAV